MTMRRWVARFFVLLLIVAVTGAVAAHFVLRSDLPRRIVLNVLQQETGLRIEAGRLQTGWRGHTSVHDLTVALPLETDPFMRASQINVSHSTLLHLLLTRSLNLEELVIQDAEVTLRTDTGGQWNIVEAAERINQAQDRQSQTAATVPMELPRLRITNAVLDVEGPDGRMIRYEPFDIQGDPSGAFAWQFNATLLPHMRVEGKLSPTAPWAHEIAFELDEIHRLIVPWLPAGPDDLRIAGSWSGQIRADSLDGRLALQEFRAAPLTARGDLNVSIIGFDVTAVPIDLRTTIDEAAVGELRLTGGRLHADGRSIRAERLVAAMDAARAQIDAHWDFHDEVGSALVHWESTDAMAGREHTGRITTSLNRTALGRYNARLDIEANGQWDDVRFATNAELAASGDDWRQLRGSLVVNRLDADEQRGSIELGGTTADLRLDWPELHLRELRLPSGEEGDLSQVFARGDGWVNIESQQWSAAFHAARWQLPGAWNGERLPIGDLAFDASGNFERGRVHSLTARVAEIDLQGSGSLDFDTLAIDWQSTVRAAPIQLLEDVALGDMLARIAIDGTLMPMKLNIAGDLAFDHAVYQERRVDDVMFTYRGDAAPDRISFVLDDLELFGGSWRGRGAVDPGRMLASIELVADAADVAALAGFIELPVEVSGRVDAQLDGELVLDAPRQSHLTGSWTLRDFAAGTFKDISGEGKVTMHRQMLEFFDMQLHDRDGVLIGQMAMDFNRPDDLHAAIALRDWPWTHEPSAIDALVHGSAVLDIDLTAVDVSGQLDLTIDLDHRREPLGRVELAADVVGRRLVISTLNAHTLETTIVGSGEVMLDEARWMDSYLTLRWDEFDLAALRRFDKTLEPLRGSTSGSLRISRDDRPRAQEPMRLDINAIVRDGSFGAITFGSPRIAPNDESVCSDIEASLNFSPDRVVLNRVTVQAIDGLVALHGRLTRHEGVPFAHMHMNLEDVDLQQIVHAAGITTDPVPGRISGTASIGGYLHETPRRFGRANLELSQSDLVALPGFTPLYNALRLDIGTLEPTGEGRVSVRLEGKAIDVTRLTYFNRGTDVVAQFRIEDITRGGDSPISGLAAGVVRPLADISLPFLDVLDRLVGAAQQDTASLRISGNVREPEVQFVPFREFMGTLRRLIRGQVD